MFCTITWQVGKCSIQVATWVVANGFSFDLSRFEWELHHESSKWDPKHALAQHLDQHLGCDQLHVQFSLQPKLWGNVSSNKCITSS